MKDPERFKEELAMPLGGRGPREVTESDIEADGASFMAFASMMGVPIPKANPNEGVSADLPSS